MMYGQSTFQPKQVGLDLKGVVYRNEVAVDFRLHTNGLALALNLGKIKTYDQTTYLHFELGYMKDPRETKQNRNIAIGSFGQSSPYAFGKVNHMFVMRAGWGYRKYLSEKAKRKGLAIGYNYEIGPALAVLKPYYLRLLYREDADGRIVTDVRNERLTDENRDLFFSQTDIYGGGGFFRGFGELGFTPGIQAKGGVFFSLGAFDRLVKTVEAGIMVDVFPKKIAILQETDDISNKPYFVNLYLNLQLGRRSN